MEGPHEPRGSPGSLVGARMPFIVSSNVEKVDPATRKLIRSHVMRGKKQKRGRPKMDGQTTSRVAVPGRTRVGRVKLEEVIEMYTSPVPGRIGSDFSFVELPDGIEPLMVLSVARVSTVATKIIFPLMAAIGFQELNGNWLHPIGRDAAALHITIFAMEGFLHRQESNTNPAAMLHFQKGLKLLQERLLGADDETKISDETMSAVVKLASAAHFNGDHEAAKQHMEGLRKMVDLRGGISIFQDTQLLVEILRCDLGISLLSGSEHVFFRRPSEPVTEYHEKLLLTPDDKMCSQEHAELMENIDHDLATAWRVMRRFCLLINLGAQTQRPMRPEIIHQTMKAVMYRLLDMGFAAGSLDEAVRNGLLAFSYHIFLQWQDIKLPCHHFRTVYQKCILGLKLGVGVSAQLMLWLLMTGAVSVFNVLDEPWLGEYLQECFDGCQVKTWKEMQGILKSFYVD